MILSNEDITTLINTSIAQCIDDIQQKKEAPMAIISKRRNIFLVPLSINIEHIFTKSILEVNYIKFIAQIHEIKGSVKSYKKFDLEGWNMGVWLTYCTAYLFQLAVFLEYKENPANVDFNPNLLPPLEGRKDYILNELFIAASATYAYYQIHNKKI